MVDFQRATEAFTHIYDEGVWGGGSGASSPSATKPYMELLRRFIKSNDIKTVVDVGCGDWQFSREIDWSGMSYVGFDVVRSVIESNRSQFGSAECRFELLSSVQDLHAADIVICKDVLQHLPNQDVMNYIEYFRSNYKYAIVTNDIYGVQHLTEGDKDCPEEWINVDIQHGQWRPLRFDLPPFELRTAALLDWTVDCDTMSWIKRSYLFM